VTLLFARRTTGMPVTSEGWNGYSASYASQFLTGYLTTPDALDVLSNYRPPVRISVG